MNSNEISYFYGDGVVPNDLEGPDTEAPIDHDAPSTHEAEQEAQPDLGVEKPVKKARAKKSKAKKEKAPAKAKKSKAAKKEPKPKAKKAPKTKKAKAGTPGHAGKHGKTIADGRKKPGTNEPVSDQAAKYGRKVAKLRAALELTQKELAAKIGLSQPGVANIERGVSGIPRLANQQALAKALKDNSLITREEG